MWPDTKQKIEKVSSFSVFFFCISVMNAHEVYAGGDSVNPLRFLYGEDAQIFHVISVFL